VCFARRLRLIRLIAVNCLFILVFFTTLLEIKWNFKYMSTLPDYEHYDALALAELVKTGGVSPQELLAEAKKRLSIINPKLNAVIYQSDSLADTLIKNLDKTSLFCGVPFLVKDLMLPFKGVPMSNGSMAMKNYIPTHNSLMASKLNSAGLITFGKTTTSELGTSSLVNTTAFGATLNPWDVTKNSGGSSGGSSVAVATRVVPMAYSSDGGGSIRLPASYCGIFGFKPSKGLNKFEDMSKAWGGAVVSHVSSVSVRDSAAYLDLVSGNTDKNYCVSNPTSETYLFRATQAENKLKIGLITEAPTETYVYGECIKGAEVAAKCCEALGHEVEYTKWNFDGRELMRAFLTVVFSYTNRDVANMAALLKMEVKNLDIELNTLFMSIVGYGASQEQVKNALDIWKQASHRLSELHQKYDVILTPTVATMPLSNNDLDPNFFEKLLMKFFISTGLGKRIINNSFLDALIDKSLFQTPFTPIANMTGQPAMTVPLYWDKNGLPHGAHFMADNGNDGILLFLAKQLESQSPWRGKVPDSSSI